MGHRWSPSRALWWATLRAARTRRRLQGGSAENAEQMIAAHAPGGSFADIGCMWNIHGRRAFYAADCGATDVVGMDVMGPTPQFQAEQASRERPIRFVQGDVHDPATVAKAGVVDTVFSAGLLYHAPHPVLTLQRLREMCGKTLLLWTATIPELPGTPNGCVFFPALPPDERQMYSSMWPGTQVGLSEAFDRDQGYANWWWGLTPSAVVSMLDAAGFRIQQHVDQPYTSAFVAHPR
ncbi:MAG: class I SAM-dependent methyltransferase [Solirubrobacterales bacterium]